MIIKEEYMTLKSGKKLYRTYSDLKVKIMQRPTGIIYDDAVDVEDAIYTYMETNEPIKEEDE